MTEVEQRKSRLGNNLGTIQVIQARLGHPGLPFGISYQLLP